MKKTISILFFCFLFTSINAQTNVIATKSHAGTMDELSESDENFGEIQMSRTYIDTVEKIAECCLVVHRREVMFSNDREYISKDTMCDDAYFNQHGYRESFIKQYFGDQPVYVGFDKPKEQPNPRRRRLQSQNNSVPFIILMITILGGYIVYPKLKKA